MERKSNSIKIGQRRIQTLDLKVHSLRKYNQQVKPQSLSAGIEEAVKNLVKMHYPRLGLKNLVKGVGDGVWNCMNGVVRSYVIGLVKKYMRKTVFSPLNLCHAMDLFGGMISFQVLCVLQWVEAEGKSYCHDLIFPLVMTMRRFIENFTGFASEKISVPCF